MNTTSTAQIDTLPFLKKHNRTPEPNRRGIWRFRIAGEDLRVWGTMPEAISTAKLCAMMDDMPLTDVALVDYTPMPKVLVLENGPEG